MFGYHSIQIHDPVGFEKLLAFLSGCTNPGNLDFAGRDEEEEPVQM